MLIHLTKDEAQLFVNMLHTSCNTLREKLKEKDYGAEVVECINEQIEEREKTLHYIDSKIPKDY